jgi:hypothetical protein
MIYGRSGARLDPREGSPGRLLTMGSGTLRVDGGSLMRGAILPIFY